MVKKWGLGFMINTETGPGGRSAGSLAWAGLANTYFWLDPKQKVTGIILTQLLPFADRRCCSCSPTSRAPSTPTAASRNSQAQSISRYLMRCGTPVR